MKVIQGKFDRSKCPFCGFKADAYLYQRTEFGNVKHIYQCDILKNLKPEGSITGCGLKYKIFERKKRKWIQYF